MCRLCNGHRVGRSGVQDGECSEIEAFEEGGGRTHERIMESLEASTVIHLFRKYVRGIAFAADMINCDSAVFDPFACHILL
jgi:hypothetical protein